MSTERREQERFSLDLQSRISYRYTANDIPPTVDTMAVNVSSGGTLLRSDHLFPMASKVKIDFYIHIDDLKKLKFILSLASLKQLFGDHVWVSTSGIIIRQEEYGVGIIFDTDYQLTPMKSPVITN